MATSYPIGLDTFTNPTSSDSLSSPSHSGLHADTADAIEALQVKVGIDSSADTSSLEYRIAQLEAAGSPIVKVAAFTSSGSWTVPAGVTYAIAHILGGGGGGGAQTVGGAGAGGDSSVAFASGTVTALGGQEGMATQVGGNSTTFDEPNNSGRGGKSNERANGSCTGGDAQWIVAGAAVTPAASITVTVGAGGTGGTGGLAGGDGGSGYVWIEYQES